MIFVVYKEKNMKKSKIIVPALAMIAFSTAASIAGSVAWFTASRQVTVDAGTYSVVKTSTNLEVDIAAGIGTSLSGDAITMGSNYLTDGGFNYDTENIYKPIDGDDGSETTLDTTHIYSLSTVTEANLTRAELSATSKVYTVVTWTVAFTMEFGATTGNYGLYFDKSASTFTCGSPVVTGTGFRMAFVPYNPTGYTMPSGSARAKMVIAPYQIADNCTYVLDENNKTGTAYSASSNILVASDWATALPAEGTAAATATARADYIGTFGFIANTNVTLHYKVVVWFDGTDANVVNQDDPLKYQTVGSLLNFKAVKLG